MGLRKVPPISTQLANGGMTKSGAPETVRDTGPTIVWNGRYLPGLWLMDQALTLGLERLPKHGVITFAMRHSHHIGCLAALAKSCNRSRLLCLYRVVGAAHEGGRPVWRKSGPVQPQSVCNRLSNA